MTGAAPKAPNRTIREVRALHPHLFKALVADAEMTAAYRAERAVFRSRLDAIGQILRLMWVSDAFFAQALYRMKARLQALHVPIIPRILHRAAMSTAQVCIGDPVIIHPGLYLAHGQVVIDGFVEISERVVIFPWVTIGLKAGDFQGPTIGREVHVGTGAKVLGPIHVGADARIGANAVVVDDVPDGATMVGIPARETSSGEV